MTIEAGPKTKYYRDGVGYMYDGGIFETVHYTRGYTHKFAKEEVAEEYARLVLDRHAGPRGQPTVTRDKNTVAVSWLGTGELGEPQCKYRIDYGTVRTTYTNLYWWIDGEWLDNDSYWKQWEGSDDD